MCLAKGVEASVEDMSLTAVPSYSYMSRAIGGIGWQATSGFHLIVFALDMRPGGKRDVHRQAARVLRCFGVCPSWSYKPIAPL